MEDNVWDTSKYYVDGKFDNNGKIVVRDVRTNAVVVKLSSVDNLYVWLKENDG